jgi:hypothetical protein
MPVTHLVVQQVNVFTAVQGIQAEFEDCDSLSHLLCFSLLYRAEANGAAVE